MPYIGNLSSSDSSLSNSSSVSCTSHARKFSMIRSLFFEPGIGTTLVYLRSIQAKETCAGVACFSAAKLLSISTMGILPAMFSRFSWGTHTRTSSTRPNSVFGVIFPDKSPLATGENGTNAILFFTQKGMTSFSEVRSTIE